MGRRGVVDDSTKLLPNYILKIFLFWVRGGGDRESSLSGKSQGLPPPPPPPPITLHHYTCVSADDIENKLTAPGPPLRR